MLTSLAWRSAVVARERGPENAGTTAAPALRPRQVESTSAATARYQLASRSGVAPILWIDRSAPSYSSSGVRRSDVTARIAP